MMNDDHSGKSDQRPRRAPLQFGLRTMLLITAAVGLFFGTLRWLGVPPRAGFIVLVVLTVSVTVAIGLVVVIAGAVTGEDERD